MVPLWAFLEGMCGAALNTNNRKEQYTMNKKRRGELERICALVEQARDALEAVQDEEEDSRDSIPESLQYTERYEQSEAASDNLVDAVSSLEDAITSIQAAAE